MEDKHTELSRDAAQFLEVDRRLLAAGMRGICLGQWDQEEETLPVKVCEHSKEKLASVCSQVGQFTAVRTSLLLTSFLTSTLGLGLRGYCNMTCCI